MDGAQAGDRYPTTVAKNISVQEGMAVCDAAFGENLGETAPSADLGGSSNYSNENFED